MREGQDRTLDYYDDHAASFEAQTVGLDLGAIKAVFLELVPEHGRVLDAGCGPGRDALDFVGRGLEVVAFDGSIEMVRLARARLGSLADVHHLSFDQIEWRETFDGIWACASLLHVPIAEFPGVALRLAAALKPGGVWYLSFKVGAGERVQDGRLFADHTEPSLAQALAGVPVTLVRTWITEDLRPTRSGELWLNAIAMRGH